MKKNIIGFCLTAVLAAAALTTSAKAANLGGATTTTGLRLRSGAGTDYATLAVAEKGDPVIVTNAAANGWYQVIYKGVDGYMSGKYLTRSDVLNADFGTGTIQGTDVRFHAGASTSSKVLGSFNTGASMTVTGVSGPWYKVSYNGTAGYVYSDYLTLSGAGQAGTVKGTGVRLRAGAGTGSKILATLNTGAAVTVLGTEGSWYKVRYNGTLGYIHSDYVVIGGASVSADALIATARSYLGVPYVYGGSTPAGFDCSGLVQYVYAQHGITLNRTAAQQYSLDGTSVSRSNLKPGDLVFFSSSEKAVGHVGMYIGSDQMIHASSGSGKVIVSNITSNYYVNNYVGAKRVF